MDMGNMDDGSNNSYNSTWVPYLHFTAGDNLFFKTLHPSSAGTVAAASIMLACLAIVERYLVVVRSSLEARWSERASPQISDSDSSSKDDRISPELATTIPRRVISPFIAVHDIPRGLIYAVQVFLRYTLMLAVMTFQVTYMISIIIGAGLGEAMFGRFCAGRAQD